jgi:hypothetical protein
MTKIGSMAILHSNENAIAIAKSLGSATVPVAVFGVSPDTFHSRVHGEGERSSVQNNPP